jgi:DNA-binding transcriptional ArsR family regulator
LLAAADAEELHLLAVGGRRRQLRSLIDEDAVRAALRGGRSARRDLTRALSTDQTVLTVSPWLRRASSDEVKRRVLSVTEAAGALLLPTHVENVLRQQLRTDVRLRRRRLSEEGPASVLAEVAEGLTYAPSPAPSRVVLIPAPAVRPIVVVVDEVRRTLIFHPPTVALESASPEEASRPDLLAATRALGDEMRLGILNVLRSGERSATDLAMEMSAPRTTLLHHLALLRAAGLIETSVGAGNTTIYSLRRASITALSLEIGRLADAPTVEKSRQ